VEHQIPFRAQKEPWVEPLSCLEVELPFWGPFIVGSCFQSPLPLMKKGWPLWGSSCWKNKHLGVKNLGNKRIKGFNKVASILWVGPPCKSVVKALFLMLVQNGAKMVAWF